MLANLTQGALRAPPFPAHDIHYTRCALAINQTNPAQ